MADLGDRLNLGGADDFMLALAKEQGVPEGFDFPTESQALAAESVVAEPVVPAEGVAPEATPGSPAPAAPAAQTAPEGYVTKEMYDNLYTLVGKMSGELGELRQTKPAEPAPVEPEYQYAPAPITDEVEESLIEAISRNGGQAVAAWAATQAPHMYETVLDLWSDPDISGDRGGARKAAEFNLRFQNELQRAGQVQEETEREQFIEQIAPVLDQQVTALGPEFGLAVGTPEVDQLLAETLDSASPALQNLIVSRDAGEREAGLRAILALAAVKGVTPGTPVPGSDPRAEAALAQARAEALARAKGEATIGTGGLQLEGNPVEPLPPDAGLASQIERLQSAPKPTSIAQGLSGGAFVVPAQ